MRALHKCTDRSSSRAEAQVLSAPLLIEDVDLVRAIARLADERRTPITEIVALAVADYVRRQAMSGPVSDTLRRLWAEHPMPLPTGLKADKRFYDSLNDEL